MQNRAEKTIKVLKIEYKDTIRSTIKGIENNPLIGIWVGAEEIKGMKAYVRPFWVRNLIEARVRELGIKDKIEVIHYEGGSVRYSIWISPKRYEKIKERVNTIFREKK